MKLYKYEIFENEVILKGAFRTKIKKAMLSDDYVLIVDSHWFLISFLNEFKFECLRKSKISGKLIPVYYRYFFKRLNENQKIKLLLELEKTNKEEWLF